MIYIEFHIAPSEPFKKGILIHFISFFIPNANPDFDKKIGEVVTWLLEFEDEQTPPLREIGLNNLDNVIVKMPYGNNMGYWTDNNMKCGDFISRFNAKKISGKVFEKYWERNLQR